MEGDPMKRLVFLIALLAVCGCVNPMLVDISNGTFCNSANVEAYAAKHEITYAQALEELRKQSDEIWQRNAQQAKSEDSHGNGTDVVQKWQ